MGLKNMFTKKPAAAGPDQPGLGDLRELNDSVPPPASVAQAAKHVSNLGPNSAPNSISSGEPQRVSPPPSSRQAVAHPSPPMSRQNSVASSSGSSLMLNAPGQLDTPNMSRLIMLGDGKHAHQLKNARRQEKLGRMLREIMGTGQKVGNDAVSAVPELVEQADRLTLMHGFVNMLTSGEDDEVNATKDPSQLARAPGYTGAVMKQSTAKSLAQKYGRCQEIIGRGSYGIVRISHKTDSSGKEQLYAVKEFRKRTSENSNTYQDRLMSEFCISSSLDHINIIHTFDLMKDTNGGCCQIMEYCSGGDLYSLIISTGTGLTSTEADCFFKQILRGVVYMHSMGVAHCDLKPENILLTRNGVCKISDFGNGECFRMAWEKEIHYSKGVFGSGPYIAPEEYKSKSFDPRAVDIWALGVIYMVMRTGSYLWRKAVIEEDDHYARYIRDRKTSKGYSPVEKLSPSKSVYVVYSILDPVPARRITGKQILNSEWGRSIKVCDSADPKEKSQKPTSSQQQQPPNKQSLPPVGQLAPARAQRV